MKTIDYDLDYYLGNDINYEYYCNHRNDVSGWELFFIQAKNFVEDLLLENRDKPVGISNKVARWYNIGIFDSEHNKQLIDYAILYLGKIDTSWMYVDYDGEERNFSDDDISRISKMRNELSYFKENFIDNTQHLQQSEHKQLNSDAGETHHPQSEYINNLIPKHVDEIHRIELEHIFSYGKVCNNKINWKNGHSSLFKLLKPLFDENIIPHPNSTDWINFSLNNFTLKGKIISEKSLRNEITRANWQ